MAEKYKCPFPNGTYETEEVTDVLAAILLSVHSTGTHTATGVAAAVPSVAANTKLEKIQHPTISTAGSSEHWSYFLTHWDDYVAATNVAGKDN